ncbi:MAG: hypothetical protein OXI57_03795 [Rhodospirillales bacterium]|nr:hypothetical protein [Rhodospirillales bacterium]
MSRYGFHGQLLHVDLGRRTSRVEDVPDLQYRITGGAGVLAARLLLEGTPPGIDPLGPENLLIFANSAVSGYPLAGLPRHVVCAKSPLTGGIGETRVEGPWGIALKRTGYDALVFHGAAERPTGLLIEDGVVTFFDAAGHWGLTTDKATDALEGWFGADAEIAVIGPAGENRVRFASIVSGRTHQAQRMGMGAVMGAKNLKAVVLKGGAPPPVADDATCQRISAEFAAAIPGNILASWQKEQPGFAVWVHDHGIDAALDVNNFGTATFGSVDNYAKPHWEPYYRGVAPCPGCANDCMKVYHVEGRGDARASAMHQEVTGAMGPNIGTPDVATLIAYNTRLIELGMDPVSLGFTLSLAMELMERGILSAGDLDGTDLRFGNVEATRAMIERIATREGAGDLLAEGAKRASARIGGGAERYAMHVKGLEMVPFEPRSQGNLATGFAVASIGPRYDICEHDWDYDVEVGWPHAMELSRTLGIYERIPMEHLGIDKVRNYKALNTLWSAADALSFCVFAVAPTRVLTMAQMADLVAAVTGWETSSHELMRFGERRNHLYRVYNNREGLGPEDDTLPDRFFDEAISEGPKQGQRLDRATFRRVIDTYYQMMGWDAAGVPLPATLYDHHLEWTLEGS